MSLCYALGPWASWLAVAVAVGGLLFAWWLAGCIDKWRREEDR